MNIRFYNAKMLVPAKDSRFEIVEGELWVKGKEICYLGDGRSNLEEVCKDRDVIVWDRELDVKGNLLMPGFKNAHTHTAMTFLRSYADDLPLQDWLNKQVFPREGQLTEDDVYWLNILGIMEYLTSGITANFDMYFFPPVDAKASVDTGFRTVQTSGLNNFGGTVELMEENYHIVNEMSDLTSFIIGFHAEYTTSMELMEGVAKLMSDAGIPNGKTFMDLTEEERRRLSSLIAIKLTEQGVQLSSMNEIARDRYYLTGMKMDAEYLSAILNNCGRSGIGGVGIAAGMGDERCINEGAKQNQESARLVVESMVELDRRGLTQMEHIQWFDSTDSGFTGMLCGIAMQSIGDHSKPTIGMNKSNDPVNLSSRGMWCQLDRGVDLAKAMREACASVAGPRGGPREGHEGGLRIRGRTGRRTQDRRRRVGPTRQSGRVPSEPRQDNRRADQLRHVTSTSSVLNL